MARATQFVTLPQAIWRLLVISLFASLSGAPLYGQQIQIRVLNGRNGKPVTHACLDVFVPGRASAMVVPVDAEGTAVLGIEGERGTAIPTASKKACNGTATPEPRVGADDAVRILAVFYVACQEYAKPARGEPVHRPIEELMPSYSVKKILASGMSASNTCGKVRTTAKPGELIFFVRPRSFWEKMRE